MSEQLVIILLIALTFLIVLIALAIPDDPSPDAESLGASSAANVSSTSVVIDTPTDVELEPIGYQSEIDNQGAESHDARRAAGVPEETGR